MQMQVETADLIFMVIAYLSWREREGEVGIIFYQRPDSITVLTW